MTALLWVVAIVALAVIGFLADRFLLWAEARGFIYYRKKKASPGTLGSAFLEVQSMLQPGAHEVVEQLREEKAESDESGDPPM